MENRKAKHPASRTGRRSATPRLAKLTRPQFGNSVPRQRLYDLLDSTACPITWISSPPGSGKTTLVSDYLQIRKIGGVWYQIDGGDSDIASFFYYLTLAVPSDTPQEKQRLPLLTPEYLPDIEGFTRRFFREFFSRLKIGNVVVFDNYQEAPIDSPLHRIIVWALSEAPPGIRLVILSRAGPPAEFAQAIANSQIDQIGWETIRLTEDETKDLAESRFPVDTGLIAEIHELSGGWAAGLVLMLERFRQIGTINHLDKSETLETIFNYFADQIFNQLDKKTTELLLRTSLLPQVTEALAQAVTETSRTLEILAELHKRQLFVDRRIGETISYQYHALFRHFLQTRARAQLDPNQWKALQVASANALAMQGYPGDAVFIYIEVQAWEPAIRLILDQAPKLLALGRWKTLQQWIRSLPEPVRNTTPWLGYWLGMCLLRVSPVEARTYLEPAFEAFIEPNDLLGQALTATAMLEAHFVEWSDYARMDRWITFLEKLLNTERVSFPSGDIELAVRAGLFTAIINRQPYRKDIPSLARNLVKLLRTDLNSNYKLLAACGLFIYISNSGDFGLMEEVLCCTRSDFHSSGASALNRVWYAIRLGFLLRYTESLFPTKARQWLDSAQAIVREHGLKHVETQVAIYRAWSEEVLGNDEIIQQELAIMDEYRNPKSPFEAAFRQCVVAFLSARRGDIAEAAMHLEEANRFFEESGFLLGRAICLIGLTVVLVESDRHEAALRKLDETRGVFFSGPMLFYWSTIVRARIAQREGNEEQIRSELQAAFSTGLKHELEYMLSEHLVHRTFTGLCGYALHHGIEPEYAKKIIRSHRLQAPSRDFDEWPWPVKIHAIGDFSIEIDGLSLKFSGKTPKKSLALLKLLAITEEGQCELDRLGALLWPDAEGDAIRNAFHVTHLRLRKLLGRDDVVVIREGRVELNPELVWTDVGAFERLVNVNLETLQQNDAAETLETRLDRILSLYRGDLLKNEPDAPWLIAARDRIKSKWLRCLKAFATHWEQQEQWAAAQSIYERILETDSVAEEIYRRLMRCHLHAGRPAEALRTYRRCRQMLSNVLGISPSTETDHLARSISSS